MHSQSLLIVQQVHGSGSAHWQNRNGECGIQKKDKNAVCVHFTVSFCSTLKRGSHTKKREAHECDKGVSISVVTYFGRRRHVHIVFFKKIRIIIIRKSTHKYGRMIFFKR